MRYLTIAATAALFALSIAPSFAQSAQTSGTTPPAVATSQPEAKTAAAPVAGKNSFTEAEAKKRLESYGYTEVGALHQDTQSVWRGTASKNGQQVAVALDYQGNIVTQ